MKKTKQLAKFGIFSTTETGADYLVTAHNTKGKPLTTYAAATAMLNGYIERSKYFIRSL